MKTGGGKQADGNRQMETGGGKQADGNRRREAGRWRKKMAGKMCISVYAEALHQEIKVGIVVPEKIEHRMVFLHGFDGSFQMLDRELPLLEYANRFHVLLIVPNMGNGYYIDRTDYPVSWFLARELPEIVSARLKIGVPKPLHIAGISMGGYGSFFVGMKYPAFFRSISCISGAFIVESSVLGGAARMNEGEIEDEISKEVSEEINPFERIRKLKEHEVKALPDIVITCGNNDMVYRRNQEIVEAMKEKKIRFSWFEIEKGAHDYASFHMGIRYALERVCNI